MTRWTRATAAEMADALGSGETTSVELTRAALRRIEQVDGALHAFLHVDAEGALAAAQASDERRAAGQKAHVGSRSRQNATVIPSQRSRAQDDEPLNSGAIQKDDSGLHAAAVRHFGSWDKALRAAKVDPASVRQRRSWDRPAVVAALKAARKSGMHLADSSVRKEDPALYGAAVRLFGTFTAARAAAKIPWKRKKRGRARAK